MRKNNTDMQAEERSRGRVDSKENTLNGRNVWSSVVVLVFILNDT